MADILDYARVSTGDQDVAGQTMRLTEAGQRASARAAAVAARVARLG
jgi:hypothetical protein